MSLGEMRERIEAKVGGESAVDVIVTTMGGSQTAHAVHDGGGLVGIRSSGTPPGGVPIEFVDWPFQLDDPSLEAHVDLVEEVTPKYAVAPDVEKGRSIREVVAVAERLRAYADNVIIVPKDVEVDAVPNQFMVGLPFRDEWDTDTGVNEFFDFADRPVHILGGNPTEQLKLARRFDLDVVSVDSPNPLAWADAGRVWVARLGGANEVKDLIIQFIASGAFDEEGEERVWQEFEAMDYQSMDADEFMAEARVRLGEDAGFVGPEAATALGLPTMQEMLESRYHRIVFTVMNLREAWNEGGVVKTTRAIAPGRGPPPPAPEGLEEDMLEMAPGEFMSREERLERWISTAQDEVIGELGPTERGLAMFGQDDEADEGFAGVNRTVVLVGCGSAKQSGVNRGKNLYTSNYFTLKRLYAVDKGDEWYILSAEHGVLDPDDLVACYDRTMDDVDDDVWAEMVLDQLPDVSDAEVVVLAGSDYLDPILPGLLRQAGKVSLPTRGMELPERMSWLSENVPG